MWTWTNRSADLALQAVDSGGFFRQPLRTAFRIIALLLGLAGVVLGIVAVAGGGYGCYELYRMQGYASGVQGFKVGILVAAAVAFLGLFLSRIWWRRSEGLQSNAAHGKPFLVGPILAHVVRTMGETVGFAMGLSGILMVLVVWPSAEYARSIPFVGGYLFGFLKYSLPLIYLSPLVGFLYIMVSRWLADLIEVLFSLANDSRAMRSNMGPVMAQTTDHAEVLPFRAGWADVVLGILIYAMLALRLDEVTALLPLVVAVGLCIHFRWKSSLVFFVAAAVAVMVRGVFVMLAEMDEGSVGHTYIAAEQPLLIALLAVLIVAIPLMVAERLEHWRSTLTFGQAWAIGCGLGVIYCAYPVVKTVQESMARHELTPAEMQRAQDVFAPYQDRRFGWRGSDRVDTTSTFTIGPPLITADRYGLITVQHELNAAGLRMRATFQCPHTDIRLPDSMIYEQGDGSMSVRYMNGDSIVFGYKNGDQWKTSTAIALDAMDRLSALNEERRTAAFKAYRDSLHAFVDTLYGRFVSYDCEQEPCFAWFDVEDTAGIAKRSLYCSAITVNGYPINALPKDDTRWTIMIRRTVLETPKALEEGTGPLLYELIGLSPETKPTPVQPEVKAQPEASAKPNRPAPGMRLGSTEYAAGDVDQEPSYPGGQSALRRYLATRNYPEVERANATVKKLRVQFVVSSTGSIGKVAVVGGQGNANFDSEAVRLISAMKPWAPGLKDGVPVAVRMEVTVNFSLSE